MGTEDFANQQVDSAKYLLAAAQNFHREANEAYEAELQLLSQKGAAQGLASSAPIFQLMARVDQAEQAVQRAKALVALREQEARDVRRQG